LVAVLVAGACVVTSAEARHRRSWQWTEPLSPAAQSPSDGQSEKVRRPREADLAYSKRPSQSDHRCFGSLAPLTRSRRSGLRGLIERREGLEDVIRGRARVREWITRCRSRLVRAYLLLDRSASCAASRLYSPVPSPSLPPLALFERWWPCGPRDPGSHLCGPVISRPRAPPCSWCDLPEA